MVSNTEVSHFWIKHTGHSVPGWRDARRGGTNDTGPWTSKIPIFIHLKFVKKHLIKLLLLARVVSGSKMKSGS